METGQLTRTDKQTRSLKGMLAHYFLTWLRLTDQPTVKVYRGFGTANRLHIQGHVLRRTALPRKKYRDNKLVNLLALLRLFLVRPYPQVTVWITCAGQTAETQSDANGFFRHQVDLNQSLLPGWHPVRVELRSQTLTPQVTLAEGTGQVLIPQSTRFGCISDIDDTFLISHSSTITKRLLVLLTENARSRQPFEGVVAHYQLLAEADSGPDRMNPFFYVSSSEWNLYDYILEFSEQNKLPDGVYMLSPLKQFGQLLSTGKNNHYAKFDRIVRIIEAYPEQQFILLGDDSQQDPIIYESIVRHFPRQIRCVYIRQVYAENRNRTQTLIHKMEAAGVLCCYFAHSADARQHSLTMGLVAS